MKRLLSTLLVCIMLFSSLASYIALDVFAGSYAAFEYSNIVANANVTYPLNDAARQRLGYSSFVTLKEQYDGDKRDSAILRMEIDNTVTFCVQPGVHTLSQHPGTKARLPAAQDDITTGILVLAGEYPVSRRLIVFSSFIG